MKSAQAAGGYILLNPKASREYEDAGHLYIRCKLANVVAAKTPSDL
jgi:hypothetical protein